MLINVIGGVLTLIGLILAIAYLPTTSKHFSGPHKLIGLVLSIAVLVQLLLGFLRPKKPAKGEVATPARATWYWVHALEGVAVIGVGIYQLVSGVSLGCTYDAEDFGIAYGVYGACAALALLFALLGFVRSTSRRASSAGTDDNSRFGNTFA